MGSEPAAAAVIVVLAIIGVDATASFGDGSMLEVECDGVVPAAVAAAVAPPTNGGKIVLVDTGGSEGGGEGGGG